MDEAGRGPLAGPVVAAAVILNAKNFPRGINDSKKLTKETRNLLFELLQQKALYGVGIASVVEIDTLNILGATKLAMQRAVANLPESPRVVLVDGNQPPQFAMPAIAVVKGDSISLSIGAASIIAKVTRDRMMEELHAQYPQYGFNHHAGYGTAQHQRALAEHGPCSEHRSSFAPIRALIEARAA